MTPEVEQQSAAGPIRRPAGSYPSSSSSSSHTALFGKYDLGRLLGCGAFAKVYHARDTRTGQSVAIKIINKQKITNPNLISNIKREISIMRRLRHPNIVKLFEVMATKTRIYFVMEFVKGGELFLKVSKGRFSEDLSRKYFQQLISAVRYCHSRGVYHRDLKLENLLVDENGDLKVSDFGLSAVTGQVRTDGLLHTLCGTPAYVAPEILTKKGYNGANVDVWSCGVVLFVLNAGFLPFNDPNLMMMYKKIYKGEYRCPKWMSSELKRFVSRLLDTNPETRITVDEITQDPWFKKGGYKAVSFYNDMDCLNKEEEAGGSNYCDSKEVLNAFDIIAFSSGLNLSGLFDDGGHQSSGTGGERVVMAEDSPARVIERVEKIVKEEKEVVLRVRRRRKEWGLEVEGQEGNLVFGLEVYRLTESLVVVEVRRKEGGGGGLYQEVWSRRIRPELLGQREGPFACSM